MKNILVLTDFSSCADNAARYAIKLSKDYGFNLVFYHSTYLYIYTATPEGVQYGIINNDIREKIELLKRGIAKNFKQAKVPLNWRKVKYDVRYASYLLQKLPDVIKDFKIDLVIMGTKGASGIERVLFGSNAAQVIDSIDCPVLTIPSNYRYKRITSIMLASEMKKPQEEIDVLIPFVRKTKASVNMMHMITEQNLDPSRNYNNEEELGKSFQKQAHYKNIKLTYVSGKTDKSLLENFDKIISKQKPEIVTMFSLRRNWFEKIFTISFSKNMAYRIKVPLLTYRIKYPAPLVVTDAL